MTDEEKAQMLRARAATHTWAHCDEWQGTVDGNGYPSIWFVNRRRSVARLLWEMVRGPIPDGAQLDHVLRNISLDACSITCVNLFHLAPVTRGDNVRRGHGPSAINSRLTVCRRGHPFTVGPRGRRCLICQRDRQHARYARQREARRAWDEAARVFSIRRAQEEDARARELDRELRWPR